jgi:hypothetical protein
VAGGGLAYQLGEVVAQGQAVQGSPGRAAGCYGQGRGRLR